MSAPTTSPTISIIGLGLTGSSLGLALRREAADFQLIGHDKDPDATGDAKRLRAVDRIEWNIHRTVEPADLVVLALPLSEVEETLGHIAEDLRPGSILFVITSVLQPAVELLAAHAPANVHVLVGHPILTGIGGSLAPRADLFEQTTFCLAPGAETDPDAVKLATDFIVRVGAEPLYIDAAEHDSIVAGVEHLPQLLAAALIRSNTGGNAGGDAWREGQRLAGRQFAQSSELRGSPAQLFSAFRANRQNLLHRLDALQRDLAQWRRWLASAELDGEIDEPRSDDHPLLAALREAAEDRNEWEARVTLKDWSAQETATPSREETSGFFRQMLFGNLGKRRGEKQ